MLWDVVVVVGRLAPGLVMIKAEDYWSLSVCLRGLGIQLVSLHMKGTIQMSCLL